MLKPVPKEAPRTLSLADFLAKLPEHHRDLYADLHKALPPGYALHRKGIVLTFGSGQKDTPICSPFRVRALVKLPATGDWSTVVELIDPAGDLAEVIIPGGKLTGKPRDAIALLSDRGLMVYDDFHIPTILRIIRNWDVRNDEKYHLVDRVGWVPEKDAFILPNGQVILQPGSKSKYRFSSTSGRKNLGSLDIWRDQVSSLSSGNPNLIFAIALGFSSALMPFTELNTVIFHFFGKTSKGKTRLLRTGLSVWHRIDSDEKTWDGTANGLEGEIAASHSILMGLDELRGDATPDLPMIIYKFANGSSKSRGKGEGGSRPRTNWSTAVISTGEYSFAHIVKALGTIPTGGQEVRMLDIPAEGTYGVFDDLHGSETSEAFLGRLDLAVRKSSGQAGAAFAERIVGLGTDALQNNLVADLQTHVQAIQQSLGVVPGDPETSAIQRVIKSFALVATAGEWATEWGITGWDNGTAAKAVNIIAQRWLDNRNRTPEDQVKEIENFREYFSENISGFVKISDARTDAVSDLLGYVDENFIYILQGTVSKIDEKIGKGSSILNALVSGGYLDKGGENKSLQFRLPSIVPGRPRAYRIRRSVLEPGEA